MRFTLGIVGHGTKPHARCFEDFARGLANALRALGHEVIPPTDPTPGRLIVFGANLLIDPEEKLPKDAIIFNAEQVAAARDPAWFVPNFERYREFCIWDYSLVNITALKSLGIKHVVYCSIGYIPSMEWNQPTVDEDIDVLHYGSMNARRREILDALHDAGVRVQHLFGIYGDTRDAWIARSKIVLNLHFYDRPIFEIFRVSHLLANRRCVVSEDGGQDPELEAFAGRATKLVPRDQIVSTCLELLRDDVARREQALRGHVSFKELDLVASVRDAVARSEA